MRFSWSRHGKYLFCKLRYEISATSKIKSCFCNDFLLFLYHYSLNSYHQLCISNWCYENVIITKKLQKTTNKIVRQNFELQDNGIITDLRKKHQLFNTEELLFKNLSLFKF